MRLSNPKPAPRKHPNLTAEFTVDCRVANAIVRFSGYSRRAAEILPCDRSPHPEAIAYLQDSENRLPRKKLITDLFLGKVNHCVLFEAKLHNPDRSVTLIKMPLSIVLEGYKSEAVLRAMVKFCAWQALEIKPGEVLFRDDILSILEEDVLKTQTLHARIYWMSALLAKYANICKIR